MTQESTTAGGYAPDDPDSDGRIDELCDEEGNVQYEAVRRQGEVLITARGEHRTGGYEVRFQDTPIAVFPPEFELRHRRPTGIVPQVITPFEVSTRFPAADTVQRVVVHDAQGKQEVPVVADGVAGPGDSFRGTSERGDLAEALADAIRNAKQSLRTDLVTWTLQNISGENGGFVGVNRLTVTIRARAGHGE